MFKNIKKEFAKGFYSNIGEFIDYVQYQKKSIPVIYNPDVCTCVANLAMNAQGKYFIMVDDFYMSASDDIKNFINYHEVGHLFAKENGRPNQFTLEDELIADRYSVQCTSSESGIACLLYLITISDDPYLVERLKAIS